MKKSIALPKRRVSPEASGRSVFSIDEFKALVRYERTRSDRNGSVFSVLVFEPKDAGVDSTDEIVSTVLKFSRSIDCVGIEEKGRIAVLLPDTANQGARTFGDKVVGELARTLGRAAGFNIYTYPENWLFAAGETGTSGCLDADGSAPIKDCIELLFVEPIPAWKRCLDIVGASVMLVFLSPVFLLLGLYIKLVSPGPAFFKQTRVGYKGVPFTFWKFRTMKADNNQAFHGAYAQSFILAGDVPMEKLDNRDPRIIPGGKAIRKSCLDELPQLWNVLRGDMSLVGPRPCIPYEAREYLRWHTHRFDVLPGLSGLWQVSGKNKLTFKQMVRLDIAYCNDITPLGDIAIILRTPFAILRMVFEAVMKKFDAKDGRGIPVSLADTSGKAVR